VGWCNKWKVTPERLKAAVAEVGTSAVSVEKALGKSGQGSPPDEDSPAVAS
jgi:hypothetical protein